MMAESQHIVLNSRSSSQSSSPASSISDDTGFTAEWLRKRELMKQRWKKANNVMSMFNVLKVSSNSSLQNGSRTGEQLDIIWTKPLEKKYQCPACVQYLRYPVQFEDCGHRVCSSCLPEVMRSTGKCPVPKCQIRITRDRVYVDKAFQNEVFLLGVKCSNYTRGCRWSGELQDLMSHVEHCELMLIPCAQGCGVSYERRFADKHLKEDCAKRGISCEFCYEPLTYETEIDHLNVCPRFPVPCPNNCKKRDIPREEVKDHCENECTNTPIACPFSECGCDHKCPRTELNKHMKESPGLHLNLLAKTLIAQKKLVSAHDLAIEDFKGKIGSVSSKVNSLEKLYGSQLVWKIDQYAEKLNDSKSGKKTTIFSPPFLSSRHGYKMALSACLYGDGKARGKHMSLFVCICKGEYDSLLSWPFCHRLTFTLLDQCEDPAARKDVTFSVKPNICKENKPFLGRPVSERNPSFGAQKYCELEVFRTRDYVRDDVIYIKVDVDCDEMVIV